MFTDDIGRPNKCPFGMVETGAWLNMCTWDSMGSQPSDPADKVCIHLEGTWSNEWTLEVNTCLYIMHEGAE